MKLTVNGTSHDVAAPGDMPLLWVLRDLLGLTGTKYGCGIGQARFGIDLRFDGLLTAVVARSPVFGGRLKSFDGSAALAVPGVRKVVEVPSGVDPSSFEGASDSPYLKSIPNHRVQQSNYDDYRVLRLPEMPFRPAG